MSVESSKDLMQSECMSRGEARLVNVCVRGGFGISLEARKRL